jgi:tRNA(Ile)-lysidine synthase
VTSAAPKSKLRPIESPFTRATDTRVRRFIAERGAVSQGERVLVAVSGGQDSTALLLILSRLASKLGLALTAAHFDHQLRDQAETTADRRFVEGLAAATGLPLVCGKGDVPARVRECKETVEEAARNLRYEFLGAEAGREGVEAVAVGHTRDDRAETVLMHIVRGSGLDGLAVMEPRCAWPFGDGPRIARPLLELTRNETRRYCLESGVEPRDDATNELLIATRNRVRHEVLPALRSINPRIDEALCRLADAAAQDTAYLDDAADAAWQSLATADGGEVGLPRAAFDELAPAIAVRLVRRAARELGAPVPQQERVEEVLRAAAKSTGKIELPGGIEVLVRRDRLTFRRASPQAG